MENAAQSAKPFFGSFLFLLFLLLAAILWWLVVVLGEETG
jgi:hypothetical protein